MQAYASVSGGVIFIPNEQEQTTKPTSYRDLLEKEQGQKRPRTFGKRPSKSHVLQSAA